MTKARPHQKPSERPKCSSSTPGKRSGSRAHRKFSPQQIEYLANIVWLYRGEQPEFVAGEDEEVPASGNTAEPDLNSTFPKLKYADVAGLCKVAKLAETEAQSWSLNPGRYVGVADREEDDIVFAERLEELNEELEVLNSEASELEARIALIAFRDAINCTAADDEHS